ELAAMLLGEPAGGRERDGRLVGEVVRDEDVSEEALGRHRCSFLRLDISSSKPLAIGADPQEHAPFSKPVSALVAFPALRKTRWTTLRAVTTRVSMCFTCQVTMRRPSQFASPLVAGVLCLALAVAAPALAGPHGHGGGGPGGGGRGGGPGAGPGGGHFGGGGWHPGAGPGGGPGGPRPGGPRPGWSGGDWAGRGRAPGGGGGGGGRTVCGVGAVGLAVASGWVAAPASSSAAASSTTPSSIPTTAMRIRRRTPPATTAIRRRTLLEDIPRIRIRTLPSRPTPTILLPGTRVSRIQRRTPRQLRHRSTFRRPAPRRRRRMTTALHTVWCSFARFPTAPRSSSTSVPG